MGADRVDDVTVERRHAMALGERLRKVRQQQQRSLHEVEHDSRGLLKASVVGAYERGERTVSISRLEDLARFYRVPIAELLPETETSEAPASSTARFVIDLVALESRTDDDALTRYVGSIRSRRGDYNGRVLTLRRSDLDALSAVMGTRPEALHDRLGAEGLLR